MTLICFGGYLATVSLAVSLGLHRRQGRRGRESVASWIGFGLGAHLLLEWSLAGFYDGLAVAPMCLAAYAWRNGRAARALLWYGVSTFMHFRGLWLLPLGVAACWRFMAGWSAGAVDGRQRREGLVGLLLGGCAALSLAWVGPWLVHFPANHVLQVAMISEWNAVHLAQLGTLTAVACAMCLGVNRMLGLCALCTLGMAVTAPQSMPWHVMGLVPMLALVPRGRLRWLGVSLTCVFIVLMASWMMEASLVPRWLFILGDRFG